MIEKSIGLWYTEEKTGVLILKIYDISQELFGCVVWPGDPSPARRTLSSMEDGALYNLSEFSMCAHNGTHIDAPLHFIQNGKSVDEMPLSKTVGLAFVAAHDGILSASDAHAILRRAREAEPDSAKRILIKGRATVSLEAAKVFAEAKLELVGNESQTIGPEDGPRETHLVLLGAEVALLEGVRLGEVAEGVYLLSAAPILLGGCEGSPCRAILIDFKI